MSSIDPKVVEAEVERLLQSTPFRSSRRSQEFVRFVVSTTLNGAGDTLKERMIGAALFRRTPDYDTSEDAIVRVKANEVRRRLVQAYQEIGPGPDVEIAIPPGSYVPEFRPVRREVTPEVQALRTYRLRPMWIVVFAAVCALLAGAWAMYPKLRPRSAYDRFWAPVLQARDVPAIGVVSSPVFHLDDSSWNSGKGQFPRTEISRDGSGYVVESDGMAMSRLTALLAAAGKTCRMRPGSELAGLEVRRTPTIIIGPDAGRQDSPTLAGRRFLIVEDAGHRFITDAKEPGRRWAAGAVHDDYGVVTRVFAVGTGQPVVMLSGVGDSCTLIAAEFLADADAMNRALSGLPAGWETKGVQIVLHEQAPGQGTAPPTVEATHVW